MSITMLLGAMFALLGETNKPTIHFFSEMFETLFSMRGRVNFTNLSRYSGYNESTFRRRFGQHFDWLSLNSMLIDFAVGVPNAQIAAVDCSFIKKSGSATFGLDRYWSGCAGQAEKGLEISALAVIDVSSEQAWMLDVVQTPAHLRVKDALETPEGTEGAVALEGTPPRSKKAIAAALQEAKRLQALEQTAKAAAQAQARIEKEVLKNQLKIEKEASKVRQAAQKAQWRTEIHQMEDAPSKKAAKQMHKEVEKAQKAAEKVQKATEKAQKATEKAQKAAQKAQKKEGENRYSRIDF